MKVTIAVHGKFHLFELARELHSQGALERLFTGYPRQKLGGENLPMDRVDTFPWLMVPLMVAPRLRLSHRAGMRPLRRMAALTFDHHVRRNLTDCDVLLAISGRGLAAGRAAQSRGIRYVCDRGSSHIVYQDRILCEEYARWQLPYLGIDPWIIEREIAEYDQADAITVPSEFALGSFLEAGVPPEKMHKVPYGVRLDRFSQVGSPDPGSFDVLFVGGVSIQKGVPDLLDAFARIQHPRKSLTFIGVVSADIGMLLERHSCPAGVKFLGRWPQVRLREIMSRSHVMVLPSIQEGMAMVQAQAMACGCPVIASEHTGAADLFTDGVEGFIVPIRSPETIGERLQELADDPVRREAMSRAALTRVRLLGGWRDYGERMSIVFNGICGISCAYD
jgi:glycosyltransferase involved in cell wall biosynthesis